jgi:hypothetical protein
LIFRILEILIKINPKIIVKWTVCQEDMIEKIFQIDSVKMEIEKAKNSFANRLDKIHWNFIFWINDFPVK